MLILQDFQSIRPNYLARTIETVQGGGAIILLLDTMQNLEDLYKVSMAYQKGMRNDIFGTTSNRFNRRFLLSIKKCGNCICVDDEFNLLPFVKATPSIQNFQYDENKLKSLKEEVSTIDKIGCIVDKTLTVDQASTLLHVIDILQAQQLDKVVGITASRGRGKSTALGLALAYAVSIGYSNIFVTAPALENLTTLFRSVLIGFDALGYKEHSDYDIIETTTGIKSIIRINIHRDHRQTICYIKPNDADKLGQCEILAIDEAAAIPLPFVRKLLGKYIVLMASTINGYEGTGRSLSLKLFEELRRSPNKKFTEVELNEPIRYAPNDPIEKWLHNLLCLDAQPNDIKSLPSPESCELMLVDRDLLFSGNKYTEKILTSIVALSVASHYKNEPDDLIMMSDSPNHRIFAMIPPISEIVNGVPDIICYIQVSLEGRITQDQTLDAINRGKNPSGDLIPWTVREQYNFNDFTQMTGIRIVRIAVHPQMQSKGYGSRAIQQLLEYYSSPNDMALIDDESKPIMKRLVNCAHEEVNYAGVAFGITSSLYRFWSRCGFAPIYVSQAINETTGEHSAIVLKPFDDNNEWFMEMKNEFRIRFGRLLGYQFRDFPPNLCDAIYATLEPEQRIDMDYIDMLTEKDVERLKMFRNRQKDFTAIEDLMPKLAELFFEKLAKVELSRLQQTLLLMIGFQKHNLQECANALDIPVDTVRVTVLNIVTRFIQAFEKFDTEKNETKHKTAEAPKVE
ncbi:RNA cytidine acetyltransferase [Histomonas meleagridis]|uniref:RNA cytidine acetyltransferase n=1 Tax=Histomonas meleagridis TaxID=135588 RepID=UPI003559D114|nr:RNA cytidine acetyltransferase [Histomonas meleagridis]KAH0801393.1 RNA cytidine acetyltransferase [Histomonas meleagridis]